MSLVRVDTAACQNAAGAQQDGISAEHPALEQPRTCVQVHHKQNITQTATDSLEFLQKQPYPLTSQMEHSTAQAGRAGQGRAEQGSDVIWKPEADSLKKNLRFQGSSGQGSCCSCCNKMKATKQF